MNDWPPPKPGLRRWPSPWCRDRYAHTSDPWFLNPFHDVTPGCPNNQTPPPRIADHSGCMTTRRHCIINGCPCGDKKIADMIAGLDLELDSGQTPSP